MGVQQTPVPVNMPGHVSGPEAGPSHHCYVGYLTKSKQTSPFYLVRSTTRARAWSRRCLACFKLTSGHRPNTRRFSFPAMTYLKRQDLPPVGRTQVKAVTIGELVAFLSRLGVANFGERGPTIVQLNSCNHFINFIRLFHVPLKVPPKLNAAPFPPTCSAPVLGFVADQLLPTSRA